MKSEDSSNSSYGDVGIMTNAISSGKLGMVNEFQLGIYAYDAIDYHAELNDTISAGLGLNKEVKVGNDTKTVQEYFQMARTINEIPYSVFVELGDVADLEKNFGTGLPVEDGKVALYPRNLLWNRYLNNHGIFVITNGTRLANAAVVDEHSTSSEKVDQTTGSYVASTETVALKDGTTKTINYGKDEDDNYVLKGFNRANVKASDDLKTGANKKLLADEQGNVIIGVRSEFGIHLMIVQKSIYEFKEKDSGDKTVPTLEEYYTTAVPGSKDGRYPKYTDEDGVEHDLSTYVNFINTVKTTDYRTRADDVRSKIKGFDSTYEYRLYELLRDNSNVKKEGSTKEVLELIDNYIDLQRVKNEDAQQEGLEDVWQTYVNLLEVQDFYRSTLKQRFVPEGCKIAFTSTLDADQKKAYEEGGMCYVK